MNERTRKGRPPYHVALYRRSYLQVPALSDNFHCAGHGGSDSSDQHSISPVLSADAAVLNATGQCWMTPVQG
jgi:hypothetical protein